MNQTPAELKAIARAERVSRCFSWAPKTNRAAKHCRESIEGQILQAEFIGWAELADSFRHDLNRLMEHCRLMGWTL